MGWFKHLPLLALLSVFPQAPCGEAFVLDRILAAVDGQIIPLSDVERNLVFFENQKPDANGRFPNEAIEQVTHRLIHHKLLLAEAQRFAIDAPSEIQIESQLEAIRTRFASPSLFEAALARHAMTVEDLREMIRERLEVEQFIDQRIRFFIIILPHEISNYYSLHQEQFPDQTPAQAEDQIRKRLQLEKEGKKLDNLLSSLKKKAKIEINLD